MKEIIRKVLRSRGYEVGRWDRFGVRPLHDIQGLFGGRSLEVIFDVGANEGQTAVQFARAFPNAVIHSFEPFSVAFEKLREASVRYPRIKPIQQALGEAVAERILHVNSHSATNSLLPNAPEYDRYQPKGWADERATTPIAVSTVDAYCRQKSILFVDLLKMDTQGYELKVLQGAENMISSGKVATIFSEVLFASIYDGQAYFHDIYEHLWARGFRLVNLYGVGVNDQKFVSWCDAVFVHPEVLARRCSNSAF